MRKYFKYAVGEILLVVIGILIALQINNWNEERKLRRNEITLLKQLNSDLKKNLEEINEINEDLNTGLHYSEKLLQFLNLENNNSDSISLWLLNINKNPIFNNANTAYKNIENNAISNISNDSLRLQITLMYEREFRNIHYRENVNLTKQLPTYREQLRKNFTLMTQFTEEGDSIYTYNQPKNLEELKKNDLFKNALIDLYDIKRLRVNFIKPTIDRLEVLIENIDKEIEQLQ